MPLVRAFAVNTCLGKKNAAAENKRRIVDALGRMLWPGKTRHVIVDPRGTRQRIKRAEFHEKRFSCMIRKWFLFVLELHSIDCFIYWINDVYLWRIVFLSYMKYCCNSRSQASSNASGSTTLRKKIRKCWLGRLQERSLSLINLTDVNENLSENGVGTSPSSMASTTGTNTFSDRVAEFSRTSSSERGSGRQMKVPIKINHSFLVIHYYCHAVLVQL